LALARRGIAAAMLRRAATLSLTTLLIGGSAAGGAHAATADEFAGKANTICSSATKKIEKLKEPTSVTGLKSFVRKTLAIAKPAQAKLEALELPTEKRSTAKKAVTLSAKDLKTFKTYLANLEAGDSAKAATAKLEKALKANEAEQNKAWRAVGATKCASEA